ncbi:MAG: recombinase family protein [Rhodobacteraceae bacterium]|nr:recombinase family protein [Paracoccaceae bacterium]
MQRTRCAIYTRKSSEDGLEQEFNSLHAQREACAAFVLSQKAEGWVLLPDAYDDGGLSGGTLERPALQRLLADVDAGRVDRIVVYKIDRLTRALADFARIVDRLDAAGASFVSVTQSFNTATSMGRLTLNMLLSFAQFEREVTAERIRDKIAASKRKGLWMGGNVPLGYTPAGRSLTIVPAEAETVRRLYDLYLQHGTILAVRDHADRLGLRTRRRTAPDGRRSGGRPFDRGHIHHILSNPIYAGRIRHKRAVHPGQHPAIIAPETWDEVQRRLQDGAARRRSGRGGLDRRHALTAPLVGKVFDETSDRLTPSHTRTKQGKRLRYYVSSRLVRGSGDPHGTGWRLPAAELERQIAGLICDRVTDRAWLPDATRDGDGTGRGAGGNPAVLRTAGEPATEWETPALLALVDRVDIAPASIAVRLSPVRLAVAIGLVPGALDADRLSLSAPFRSRRRGVERKLILGDPAASPDATLIRNLARAHAWFAELRAGRSYAEIAARAGTSKRRVMQLVELAFLAPDLAARILDGRQPAGLTSDLLIKQGVPESWPDQRRLFDTLG